MHAVHQSSYEREQMMASSKQQESTTNHSLLVTCVTVFSIRGRISFCVHLYPKPARPHKSVFGQLLPRTWQTRYTEKKVSICWGFVKGSEHSRGHTESEIPRARETMPTRGFAVPEMPYPMGHTAQVSFTPCVHVPAQAQRSRFASKRGGQKRSQTTHATESETTWIRWSRCTTCIRGGGFVKSQGAQVLAF